RARPMAQMSAIPQQPLWKQILTTYNPGAVATDLIMTALGDAAVTFGFGAKHQDPYGMEYVANPITGALMTPGDVQEAKFATITSLIPGMSAESLAARKTSSIREIAEELSGKAERLRALLENRAGAELTTGPNQALFWSGVGRGG